MIRETSGTIYITAACFRDRYHHAEPQVAFSYATGDLSRVADADALELLQLVCDFEAHGRVTLDVHPIAPGKLDYRATKLRDEEAR